MTTTERARHLVDSLKKSGADFIKVHLVSPEVYFAVAREARRLDIPFGGHIPGDTRPMISAVTASDSGASVVDHLHSMIGEGHCFGVTATVERCKPIVRRFKENGTWLVPTFIVHSGRAPYTRRWRRFWPETLRGGETAVQPGDGPSFDSDSTAPARLRLDIMQELGMPVLAGTDAAPIFPGVPPGFSLHDEMANLVWAGMSPLVALQAATLNPAKLFHATDSLGTVSVGKLADLVLLDANPLADITNTTRIAGVVANGRYFDRAALDRLLSQIEERAIHQ